MCDGNIADVSNVVCHACCCADRSRGAGTGCLTAMPVGIVAVVGVSGESLSSFAVNFLWFLKNRKVVGAEKSQSRKKRERARHTKTKGKESVTDDEEFT